MYCPRVNHGGLFNDLQIVWNKSLAQKNRAFAPQFSFHTSYSAAKVSNLVGKQG